MLISDSMPLLWLCYAALSLVVLVSGYLAIRWLPRLPRFLITGLVAGMLWMPAGFSLPTLEEGESHAGRAPAVVVASVAYLQQAGDRLGGALELLLLGAGLGAGAGVMLWAWLRQRKAQEGGLAQDNADKQASAKDDRPRSAGRRREPQVG